MMLGMPPALVELPVVEVPVIALVFVMIVPCADTGGMELPTVVLAVVAAAGPVGPDPLVLRFRGKLPLCPIAGCWFGSLMTQIAPF